MYTGVRFKGIVKEKFREEFSDIAMKGNWSASPVPEFREYGKIPRSGFIPCGALSYMPDSWEMAPYDRFGDGVPTDGFDRTYDKNTGRWTFQCSLKNYEDEIEEFFKLIPFFIESIEHLEYYYEEWGYSSGYSLEDGKVVLISDKFVRYPHSWDSDDEDVD